MIRRIREMVLSLTGMCIAVVALSSLLIASYELETWPWVENLPLRDRYEIRPVRRTTLSPFLSAPGRVESSRRTVVRCQLENMAGSSSTSGGSSTIIWLIPEGAPVKEGEILATLDASTYEEMLRQQLIVVDQAKTSHLQARLNYEIAQLAVREYVEGTVQQTVQQMEGNLAMARSDLSRRRAAADLDQDDEQQGLHVGGTDRDGQAGRDHLGPRPPASDRQLRPVHAVHQAQDAEDTPGRCHHRPDVAELTSMSSSSASSNGSRCSRGRSNVARSGPPTMAWSIISRIPVAAGAGRIPRMGLSRRGWPSGRNKELFYLPDLSEWKSRWPSMNPS